jgi:subtilisin family serine protease
MRFRYVLGTTALLGSVVAVSTAAPTSAKPTSTGESTYVVLADTPDAMAAAEQAAVAAGGTVTGRNTAIGMLTVQASGTDFATEVRAVAGVAGVASDRSIGSVPRRQDDAELDSTAARVEGAAQVASASSSSSDGGEGHDGEKGRRAEPLADKQWDMKMIGATVDGSYAEQRGRRKVLVGIIDTGIDGTHPDIRPNFSYSLSRNFTTDNADLGDNTPGQSDPVDVDDDGHGTHVAGTIGAPLNGLGMAGVAPNVTLVNIRAGQDSGYFLLDSTANALTYAGDKGIDVVNMSFYVDPWLFNCPSNPKDSLDAQAEQRTIIETMQRALRYARSKGVTLVAALGNSHFNYDDITSLVDESSPDFPTQTAYARPVQADCLDLPTMGDGVIGTISVGPSGTKADYSNWSQTYGEVSAPGGWFRDGFGTPTYRTDENQILAPYPESVGLATGDIDPITGEPTTTAVVKDCKGTTCAYYQWIQGTSMASPHAAGVAALIVSEYGKSGRRGSFGMDPDKVAKILFRTATDVPCPANPVIDYIDEGRTADFTATCVGTAAQNNIWGNGIVNALAAVTDDHHHGHDD